jgi:hypothetical protein
MLTDTEVQAVEANVKSYLQDARYAYEDGEYDRAIQLLDLARDEMLLLLDHAAEKDEAV